MKKDIIYNSRFCKISIVSESYITSFQLEDSYGNVNSSSRLVDVLYESKLDDNVKKLIAKDLKFSSTLVSPD